jgi:chemotaxis protein histidine kinase CheA
VSLLNLEAMVEFTHVVESVLDGVRNQDIEMSADRVALLLRYCPWSTGWRRRSPPARPARGRAA